MLDELGTKVKLNLFTIVHVWFKDLQPQLLIYWCGWFKHEIFSGKERYIDAGKQPGWRTDGLMIESFLVNRRLVSRLQRICAFLIIHNIIFFSYFLLPLKILCQWTMIVYNLITVKIKPTSLLLLLLFQEIQGVSWQSTSGIDVLQACFETSEALWGFYVTQRLGANYF